ncbi:MAG: hypothetical protein IKW98_11695 [Prevotella sp.]|nr:hypothetical protein [Prevotella sp.]
MKLNKLFLGLLGMAAMTFSACSSDDDKYEWATVSGDQVYFSQDLPEVQEISKSASSFTVPVLRVDASKAITVNLVSEKPENSVFTIPTSVSFEAGQKEALVNVTYNPDDVVYGNYEDLTIALADSLQGTAYGASSYNFKAGVTAWVSMGEATYTDDLINCWWNTGNPVYKVEVEKSIIEEGMYRLVNPYGEVYPYNEPGDWDASKDYYITINAKDPNFVYVERGEIGMDWGYGMISVRSYVEYYLANDVDLETVKGSRPDLFGKLENGVITMPANSMLISMTDYKEGNWYITAANGKFQVLLPGAVITDYSAEVNVTGIFTDLAGTPYATAEVILGADATNVKAVVVPANADADAVADAVAAGDLEAIDVEETGVVNVPIAEDMTGDLQVVIVVLDANGAVRTVASSNTFEYYGGGSNPWRSLGIGTFTDNFVMPNYYADASTKTVWEPQTFEVEILENTETPGLYRLVDAYKEAGQLLDIDYESTNIEVNATNPNGVYISAQSTGLSDDGDDVSIVTNGARYLGTYTLDELIGYGYMGKLQDGVITFPNFPYKNQETGEVQFTYQGIIYFGTSGYYAGSDGSFVITLPDAAVTQSRSQAPAFINGKRMFAGQHKADFKKLRKQLVKKMKSNVKNQQPVF